MPAPPVSYQRYQQQQQPPPQQQYQQQVYYEQQQQPQPQIIYMQQPQAQVQIRQPRFAQPVAQQQQSQQAFYVPQQQQQQKPQVVYVQQQQPLPVQSMPQVPRIAAPPPRMLMPNPNQPLKPSDRFRMRLAQEDPSAYARKKMGEDLKAETDGVIQAPPPAHILEKINDEEEYERKRQRMMKGAADKHALKHEAKGRQREFLGSRGKYMQVNKEREKQQYKDVFGISMTNLLEVDKQVNFFFCS